VKRRFVIVGWRPVMSRRRAPEVVLGHEWDTAIDIFGFGCILMEMLTGRQLLPTVRVVARR
jgi:hypothetical protein